jgi:hypothetical protein
MRLINLSTDKLFLPAWPHQLMPSTGSHNPIHSSRCLLRAPYHLPRRCRHQLHFPHPPRHLRNHYPEQRYKLRTGYLRNPHFVRVRWFSGSHRLLYHRRDELRKIEGALDRCWQRRILCESPYEVERSWKITDKDLGRRDSNDLPRQSDAEPYRLEPGRQVWIHLGWHCGGLLC